MRKNEKGTILIEFIGSFLLFFLLIISILSLVNIVTAQARVHYALTETANTLSMYGYVLSATDQVSSQEAEEPADDINAILNKLNQFQSGFSSWEGSVPSQALQSVMGAFLGEVQATALKGVINELVLSNLATGAQSGEEYLRSVRISNLELTEFASPGSGTAGKESTLYDSQDNIKLTVEYEIDYTFMGLPIPFEPKLKVAQSVKTKMWFQREGYRG